jgi:hypothetical protein
LRLVSGSRTQDVARAMRKARAGSSPGARTIAWTTIVLAGLGLIALARVSRPLFVNPTDAMLAQRLEKNPAEFLNLAVQREHDDAAPNAEYRARLRQIGLQDVQSGPAGVITFPASPWWPRVLGDVKGFAFSSRPPQPIVASLDHLEFERAPGKRYRFYRSLGGDWYAYREIRPPRL